MVQRKAAPESTVVGVVLVMPLPMLELVATQVVAKVALTVALVAADSPLKPSPALHLAQPLQ